MTEDRKKELLANIEFVASNDATEFTGTDYDVKIQKNQQDGSYIMDLVVHSIK